MHEQLRDLPEIPLPDGLWQRVDGKRRQKLWRRKLGARPQRPLRHLR